MVSALDKRCFSQRLFIVAIKLHHTTSVLWRLLRVRDLISNKVVFNLGDLLDFSILYGGSFVDQLGARVTPNLRPFLLALSSSDYIIFNCRLLVLVITSHIKELTTSRCMCSHVYDSLLMTLQTSCDRPNTSYMYRLIAQKATSFVPPKAKNRVCPKRTP